MKKRLLLLAGLAIAAWIANDLYWAGLEDRQSESAPAAPEPDYAPLDTLA